MEESVNYPTIDLFKVKREADKEELIRWLKQEDFDSVIGAYMNLIDKEEEQRKQINELQVFLDAIARYLREIPEGHVAVQAAITLFMFKKKPIEAFAKIGVIVK